MARIARMLLLVIYTPLYGVGFALGWLACPFVSGFLNGYYREFNQEVENYNDTVQKLLEEENVKT